MRRAARPSPTKVLVSDDPDLDVLQQSWQWRFGSQRGLASCATCGADVLNGDVARHRCTRSTPRTGGGSGGTTPWDPSAFTGRRPPWRSTMDDDDDDCRASPPPGVSSSESSFDREEWSSVFGDFGLAGDAGRPRTGATGADIRRFFGCRPAPDPSVRIPLSSFFGTPRKSHSTPRRKSVPKPPAGRRKTSTSGLGTEYDAFRKEQARKAASSASNKDQDDFFKRLRQEAEAQREKEARREQLKDTALDDGWRRHEAALNQFWASPPSAIAASDVPFPDLKEWNDILLHRLKKARSESEAGRKELMKGLTLRWHPDKFIQHFGAALVDTEREEVMRHVTKTFQTISDWK